MHTYDDDDMGKETRANFGADSTAVAKRQRATGPPAATDRARLAERLELLQADGHTDAQLLKEAGLEPGLPPPRGWHGGRRLGAAGILLLLSAPANSPEPKRRAVPTKIDMAFPHHLHRGLGASIHTRDDIHITKVAAIADGTAALV